MGGVKSLLASTAATRCCGLKLSAAPRITKVSGKRNIQHNILAAENSCDWLGLKRANVWEVCCSHANLGLSNLSRARDRAAEAERPETPDDCRLHH